MRPTVFAAHHILRALVSAAFFCVATIALAHEQPSSVDAMLKQAHFVFEGTVAKVEYRFSEKAMPSQPDIPYTFVTYNVQNVLMGNYAGNTVTLRFIGGPKDESKFLMMAQSPLFDVGDHDLLLVANNDLSFCPLVNCAAGRFRYIDGLVVNEEGQTITINPNGTLAYGETVDLPEVNTHQMSDTIKLVRSETLDKGQQSEMISAAQVPRGALPSPDEFTRHLQQEVFATHTADQLANLPPFHSSDPTKPFKDDLMTKLATAPPAQLDPVVDTMPADERLERMIEAKYRDRFNKATSEDERQKIREEIWAKYPALNPNRVRSDSSTTQFAMNGSPTKVATAPEAASSTNDSGGIPYWLLGSLVAGVTGIVGFLKTKRRSRK